MTLESNNSKISDRIAQLCGITIPTKLVINPEGTYDIPYILYHQIVYTVLIAKNNAEIKTVSIHIRVRWH